METLLHEALRSGIEDQLRERFRKAAMNPEGLFAYPTGRAGLIGLGYKDDSLSALPEAVQAFYCGVGNPFAPGLPEPGERVLDIGCGAGVDALIAAHHVGLAGRVTGLEFSVEMLERARANAEAAGTCNAEFVQGGAESLPLADESFDLVISNGVFNLVLRKRQALAEALRVLRPGGRLQVADQVLPDATQLAPLAPSPADWAT